MKKILIIVFVFLCCGCSAKYEIELNDDRVYDNLSVSFNRDGITSAEIDQFYSDSFYALGRDKLYNYKNLSSSSNFTINYNYDYSIDEYSLSNIPNSCFDGFKFFSDDDKYYLFVSGVFKCNYYEYISLDSLDIVISTNHSVLDNNADEVINGKYIWHVDSNEQDFSLQFITEKSNKKIEKNNLNFEIIMYVGIGGLFFLIIALFILIKNKRVNKI